MFKEYVDKVNEANIDLAFMEGTTAERVVMNILFDVMQGKLKLQDAVMHLLKLSIYIAKTDDLGSEWVESEDD